MTEGWREGRWNFAAAAFLSILLLTTPMGGGLVRWSYDLLFSVRPDVPIEDVVMVYIDGATLDDLPPIEGPVKAGERLDRRYYAGVLSNLTVYGAKMVVFDINFAGYETNEADLALRDAIGTQGEVYLGAWLSKGDHRGVYAFRSLEWPRELLSGSDHWGVSELNHDPDGVVRQHFHIFPYGSRVPSLSWRVAETLSPGSPLAWGSRGEERWLNYYGPEEHFPAVSFARVYNRLVSGGEFRGKVVFVGAGETAGYPAELREAFPSPYSWSTSRSMAGVDLHATICLNLVRRDWLTRFPRLIELLVLVASGALAGMGLVLVRPRIALGAGIGGGIAVAGVTFLLFWWGKVWFPWLLISGVQVPAALIGALVRSAEQRESPSDAEAVTTDFEAGSEGKSVLAIPDHELLRQIGSGGYGEVWIARSVMGVLRAVKVVRRQASGPDKKFEREFAGLKRFEPVSRSHQGLVDILHVGLNEAGGYFYYVMELADDAGLSGDNESGTGLEGDARTRTFVSEPGANRAGSVHVETYVAETLRCRILRQGLPPVADSLRLGIALVSTLEYLHRQGLVHRDIKPTNIIFVNGVPKLADIGLVTGAGEARSFVGTFGYIPPEGPGAPTADIYSLGMVLYEASTGMGSDQFPKLPPELEKSQNRAVSLKLYEVILKACEEDVERRYQSAAKMLEDLQSIRE